MQSSVLIAFAAIAFGIYMLIYSADRLVDSVSVVAQKIGVSPFLIGLFIIGFGTSSPEIFISAVASLVGNGGLVFGNAYGSNILNIALVLGLLTFFSSIPLKKASHKPMIWLLVATAISAVFLLDGVLSRVEGFFLILSFAVFVITEIRSASRMKSEPVAISEKKDAPQQSQGDQKDDAVIKAQGSLFKNIIFTILSLVALILSSIILIWGAENLAKIFGIPDLFIGLTVLAVGTSLPELASTIASIKKKSKDLIMGAVIGSNILNTLVAVGIGGSISTLFVPHEALVRDIPVMVLVTIFLALMIFSRRSQGLTCRWHGVVLLSCYLAYTAFLIVQVTG